MSIGKHKQARRAMRAAIGARTVLESHSLDAGDGLDDGRFSVSDMTDGAYVDGGLSGNNFGSRRRQCRDIEILRVGLRRQRRPLNHGRRRYGRLGLGLRFSLGFRSALRPRFYHLWVFGLVDHHGRGFVVECFCLGLEAFRCYYGGIGRSLSTQFLRKCRNAEIKTLLQSRM